MRNVLFEDAAEPGVSVVPELALRLLEACDTEGPDPKIECVAPKGVEGCWTMLRIGYIFMLEFGSRQTRIWDANRL
jgi:hypothetical protein